MGAGVLELLQGQPQLFEVGPVLVRSPERHEEAALLTSKLEEAVAGDPDILVELVGGVDVAREAMHNALLQGVQVVTANKAAVARDWDSLHAAAVRHGGELRLAFQQVTGPVGRQ